MIKVEDIIDFEFEREIVGQHGIATGSKSIYVVVSLCSGITYKVRAKESSEVEFGSIEAAIDYYNGI